MAKGIRYAFRKLVPEVGGASEAVRKLKRGLQIVLYERFNRTVEYSVPFGAKSFKFLFLPLGEGQGSRGLFFERENYEPLLKYGHELLRDGGVVIDCGANQGVYTCAFASAVGSSGRVIAVEPIPKQIASLKRNILLNSFQNCTVIQAAISDSVGTAALFLRNKDVEATLVRVESGDSLEVNTVSLDSIASNLERMDLVKLDVEGAEAMAIDGGHDAISRFKPIIVCEANGQSRFDVAERIVLLGYKAFLREEEGWNECAHDAFSQSIFFIHEDKVSEVLASLPVTARGNLRSSQGSSSTSIVGGHASGNKTV